VWPEQAPGWMVLFWVMWKALPFLEAVAQ